MMHDSGQGFGRRLFTKLAFQDVGVFTVGDTRVSVNGIDATTHHELCFEPVPGKGKPIRFLVETRRDDADVEALRDGISSDEPAHFLK